MKEQSQVRKKMLLMVSGLALAGASVTALPAQAQQPAAADAQWSAGTKVSDTAGGEVGTIAREDGDFVILKTDKHEVRLPKTSFTAHNGGFIMAMTRAQVNSAVEQTLAQADEKIKVGANVSGPKGNPVGTIHALEEGSVTLKLETGKLVQLPRSSLVPGPEGAVIGMTLAEIEAAAVPPRETAASEAKGAAASDDED